MAKKIKHAGITAWLMKSEPDPHFVKGIDISFSLEKLKTQSPNQTEPWTGVRGKEARNILRDCVKVGHRVLFYHSSTKNPGIVGIAEVVKDAYPDPTAFDSKHPYYDSDSDPNDPSWYCVDVKFVREFKRAISLPEMKSHAQTNGPLADMAVLRRARLSVSPVSQKEWDFILSLENTAAPEIPKKAKKAKGKSKSKAKAKAEKEADADGAKGKSKAKGKGKGKKSKTKKSDEEQKADSAMDESKDEAATSTATSTTSTTAATAKTKSAKRGQKRKAAAKFDADGQTAAADANADGNSKATEQNEQTEPSASAPTKAKRARKNDRDSKNKHAVA